MNGIGTITMTGFSRLAAACIVTAGLAGFGAATPAHAQLFGGWFSYSYGPPEVAPGSVLIHRLARQGYRPTSALSRRGDVVVVDVVDRRGRPLRIIMSAADGSILQRFAMAPQPQPQGLFGYSQDGEPMPPRVAAPRARHHHPKPKTASRTVPPATPAPITGAPEAPAAGHHPSVDVSARPATIEPVTPPPISRAPRPAGAGPAPTTNVEAARAASSTSAAAPAAEPASPAPKPPALKPKPGPDRPGYANGVPINPLD
jgi:hypothetical protein